MEQDRAPVVQPHKPELEGTALGIVGSDHQPDRIHDDQKRPESEMWH